MPLPAALLRSLGEVVGDAAVLAEPEDLIPFGFDGTAALRQRPGGVVFPHTTEEVVRCVRVAAEHRVPDRDARIGHRPERRQRAHGEQSGALPRADERSSSKSTRETSRCGRKPGVITQKIDEAANASRPLLSARSGLDAHQHHRRQRRREFRRPARPEIRRDPRLRHGPGSRPARRSGRTTRQQVREGRRRLLAEGPLHRLGRHARHHHRGAAQAAAATGRATDDAGALRSDRGRGRDRVGHHRGADHSLHAGVSRPHDHAMRGGLRARRPADRLRRDSADGDRRTSGGGRRRSGENGGDRRTSGVRAPSERPATRPKR